MLYSNKLLVYNKTTIDRWTYNSTILADITNDNLDERITLFHDQLNDDFAYSILLRYFTDIGKINFPLKINFKLMCHVETDLKKLFESKKKVAAIGVPDAKIVFIKGSFVQYVQFLLDKNFRQYIETIMILKKILRMGVQKTTLQKKKNEMSVVSDSINVEFVGSNKQFDWLKIYLLF